MQFFSEKDIMLYHTVRFNFIKTEMDGHVFRLTLNRPEKRNAFTPTMACEIAYALAFANSFPEVRCVVIDAAGPVFCAGADLNAFHDTSFDSINETLPKPLEIIRLGDAFKYLLKPSIARIQGSVLAGGFLLVAGCNFVYSIPDAIFGLPEVKRGIWPMQVMASLEGIISPRKILEMAITGKNYTTLEMLKAGLVSHISQNDTIVLETESLAELIVNNAPLAIKAGLQAFSEYKQLDTNNQHRYLQEKLNVILQSNDAMEGIVAFKEKRKPQWHGN